MENIEKIKKEFYNKYLLKIPDEIDNKKDINIYKLYYNINYLYLDLITNYVMDDEKINYLLENYLHFTNTLQKECIDFQKTLILMYNSFEILNILKDFVIENELYEGAANLKRFNDLLEENDIII